MTTNKRNSLIGISAEIRLEIYQHLFEESAFRLYLSDDWSYWRTVGRGYNPYDILVHEEGLIDDGITLTCHLLREEALPELRRSLHKLECVSIGEWYWGLNLPIKPDYLAMIRIARIKINGELSGFPFECLKSLEAVFFEDESHNTMMIPVNKVHINNRREWFTALNAGKVTEAFKDLVENELSLDDVRGMSLYDNLRTSVNIKYVYSVSFSDGSYAREWSTAVCVILLLYTNILTSPSGLLSIGIH